MNLTSSHYKYLLAIYQISKKHPQVSSADVARKLNVSKPSVSTMLTSLVNKGLVAKERYGKVNLTEEGRQIAAKLDGNCEILVDVLNGTTLNLTEKESSMIAGIIVTEMPDRNFG